MLDDANNRKALGYSGKPVLYAVKALHSDVDLPQQIAEQSADKLVLTKVTAFGESDLQKLRRLEDVPTIYRVMHVEES
jgi:hypothetical protein